MAAPASWTLKVEFEGEVRRLREWPEDGQEPSLSLLRGAAGTLFGFSQLDAETLSIKYRDDEGDLCTLNEATLTDALDLAADPPRLLRLTLARATPAAVEEAQPESLQAAAAGAGPAGAADGAGVAGPSTRQRLGEGLQHFGRQVVSDFCSAREDARDAFRPKGGAVARQEEGAGLAGKITTVPATLFGAVVAARLAPVRLTRLAAHSVATVAGKTVPADGPDFEGVGAGAVSSSEPAGHQADATTAGDSVDMQACLKGEFKHFTKQVTQDFQSAKADVKAALGYFVGSGPADGRPGVSEERSALRRAGEQPEPSERPEPEQPPQPQQWTAKSAAPAVAATVAGVTVASTLVPLRAVRLAVAGAAAVASAAAAGRPGTPEAPTAEPAAATPEARRTGAAAAEETAPSAEPAAALDVLEADEELARRLQAEEEEAAAAASAHPPPEEDAVLARRLQAEADAEAAAARAAGATVQ
mmetsp:Transcript_105379/g.330074  ORF Transcript_105379/g.330074 Transcript_105379/m.330074 type:complete len:473 (+) Transcript_105379:43-1461(+)